AIELRIPSSVRLGVRSRAPRVPRRSGVGPRLVSRSRFRRRRSRRARCPRYLSPRRRLRHARRGPSPRAALSVDPSIPAATGTSLLPLGGLVRVPAIPPRLPALRSGGRHRRPVHLEPGFGTGGWHRWPGSRLVDRTPPEGARHHAGRLSVARTVAVDYCALPHVSSSFLRLSRLYRVRTRVDVMT